MWGLSHTVSCSRVTHTQTLLCGSVYVPALGNGSCLLHGTDDLYEKLCIVRESYQKERTPMALTPHEIQTIRTKATYFGYGWGTRQDGL